VRTLRDSSERIEEPLNERAHGHLGGVVEATRTDPRNDRLGCAAHARQERSRGVEATDEATVLFAALDRGTAAEPPAEVW
jgi:hypothetical protein